MDKEFDKKKKLTSLIGAVFIVFALVGIITTCTGIVRLVGNIINDNSRKTKYEDFLAPVVMLDPAYFETPVKSGQSFLIQASLWELVYQNGVDYYTKDDIGNIMITASDVEVAAGTLFGKSVELVHQSVGDINNQVTYLEENKTYHLSLSSAYNCYTPEVAKISKSGDTVTLTVGYMPPDANFGGKAAASKVPDKFAYYILKENGDGVKLVAIKEMATETQEELIAKYTEKVK